MTSFDAFGETGRFECKRLDPGARLRRGPRIALVTGSRGLQPNSDGLQPGSFLLVASCYLVVVASNLIAMASNLVVSCYY